MDDLLNSSAVADLIRRDKTVLYQWFNTPECEPILPARRGVGESRLFTRNQILLLMILSDLHRWGLTVPFAGKLTCRIAEALFEQPGADRLLISFHENGASFFYPAAADREPALTENGAGPSRFVLTIDLRAYRAAIAVTLSATERANVAA